MILCLNEEEAKRAKTVREKVVTELREKLSGGTKELIGDSAYRKYVNVEKDVVSLDEKKIAAEQRSDGSTSCSPTRISPPTRSIPS